jgi:hypothetical protein
MMMRLRPLLLSVLSLILCCALLPSPVYAASHAHTNDAAKDAYCHVSYLSTVPLFKCFQESVVIPNLDDQQGSWISTLWKVWMRKNVRTSSVFPATGSIVSPLSLRISRHWILTGIEELRDWTNSLFNNNNKYIEESTPVVQEIADVSTIEWMRTWILSWFPQVKYFAST